MCPILDTDTHLSKPVKRIRFEMRLDDATAEQLDVLVHWHYGARGKRSQLVRMLIEAEHAKVRGELDSAWKRIWPAWVRRMRELGLRR